MKIIKIIAKDWLKSLGKINLLECNFNMISINAIISKIANRMVQTSIFVNMLGLIMVAPPGFEPGSQDPESQMMDHYTTGLHFIFQ